MCVCVCVFIVWIIGVVRVVGAGVNITPPES